MKIYISKFWHRYVKYSIYHYVSSDLNAKEKLPFLRNKLFINILLISLPIGVLIFIPSIIATIMTHQFIIGIFDTIALLVLIFIFFRKNIEIQTRKILYITNFYILAIILLIYLGIQGSGYILLLVLSVLVALFYGKKTGLISIVLNAIILMLLILASIYKEISPIFSQNLITEALTALVINFIAFNTIIVLSVSFLIDELNQAFLQKKRLQVKLKIESQALLHAKLKAEESDRLKSAFLANMSHEVRTPLNSIIGFSELLADADFDEENKKKFIHHIVSNGNNLLIIISDIMDISKMESGEITIRQNQINARNFIARIEDQFSFQAKAKKLELKLILPVTDKEPIILADEERLEQIFNNLISNALKFTSDGSIEIGYQLKGDMLEFFVKDTGIGIPSEHQDIIFERFRQIEYAKTRKYGGNGLGLVIAKNLVELMGGEIWVISEFGIGTVFYFTLPLYQ